MSPSKNTHLNRRQTLLLLTVVLGLAGAVIWRAVHHYSADQALEKGRQALRSGDPAAARGWLDRAQDTYPQDSEVHFLSAIAARRSGDRAAASAHLEKARRYGWDPVTLRAEAALQTSSGAPFADIEPALRAIVDLPSENTCDALESLARGYLARFRIREAERVTERWVQLAPANPSAWEVRADVLERLERMEAAREALGRWVETDPDGRKARLGLVRLLLDGRRPIDEITPHLEMLTARFPNDSEVLRFQAAAMHAQGRTTEAITVLDRAIASEAPAAILFSQRAKMDLDRGQASNALPFARKAVAADPSDVEARFTLFRCLQQVGSPEEAAAAEASWRQVKEDLIRVREIGRMLSSSPTAPSLRTEMGELFLRNGRETEGLRWIESALQIDPGFAPAHRVLAAHYTRTNRPELAKQHLDQAAP